MKLMRLILMLLLLLPYSADASITESGSGMIIGADHALADRPSQNSAYRVSISQPMTSMTTSKGVGKSTNTLNDSNHESLLQSLRHYAITGFSAFFGTFVGAFLVFLFQRRHEAKKEQNAKISAGKWAQFTIYTQLNALMNIKQQYLDPKRDDQYRELTLPPISFPPNLPQIDLPGLVFLLESNAAQILNEIMISEQRFLTIVGVLEQRNPRHEQMQHLVANSAAACVGPAVIDDATRVILKAMTDSIYDLSDGTIKSHKEVFDKLKVYLEESFPKAIALKVEFNA